MTSPDFDLIIRQIVYDLIVSSYGPQGPKGDPGATGPPGSGIYYLHTQAAPASTWIVTHNLGLKVGCTLFDTSGELIYGDVTQGSLSTTTITFPSPIAGYAVFP